MDGFQQPPVQDTPENSLEGSSTVVVPSGSAVPPAESRPLAAAASQMPSVKPGAPHSTKPPWWSRKFKERLSNLNVYLLVFILIVVVGAMTTIIALVAGHKSATPNVSTQNLSQSQLEQLATTNVSVGNPNQVLSIGSNAIFGQQVLIQKDLDVAGNLKVGNGLNLSSLTVTGTSTFGATQLSKLAVAGDTALQGSLNVGQNLSVAGSATFNGSVSVNTLAVQSLQLTGDVTFNGHIIASGSTPSRTTGSAVGSGGTTSVSGSDTAGSIDINTGSSPSAGCLITVAFSGKFSATPHVVVTPIDSGAAGLAYYVTRSTTNFSVCATIAPPAGQSFGFDYIIFD